MRHGLSTKLVVELTFSSMSPRQVLSPHAHLSPMLGYQQKFSHSEHAAKLPQPTSFHTVSHPLIFLLYCTIEPSSIFLEGQAMHIHRKMLSVEVASTTNSWVYRYVRKVACCLKHPVFFFFFLLLCHSDNDTCILCSFQMCLGARCTASRRWQPYIFAAFFIYPILCSLSESDYRILL